MAKTPTKEWLADKAARMAACPTAGEARAADALNAAGIEFYPQVVLSTYILDFVVPAKLLVVEIDGASHDKQVLYDQFRDAFCQAVGLQVLRIPNYLAHTSAEQVAKYPNQPDALERIKTALRCANGTTPGTKGVKALKTTKEKEKGKRRRAAMKRGKAKKAAAHKEREQANAAARAAGLPTPAQLRRKANRLARNS